MLLHPRGIGVPDCPPELFEFGLADHARMSRIFEPFIAAGFSDEEAWAAQFDDEFRLQSFRVICGNRKGRKR